MTPSQAPEARRRRRRKRRDKAFISLFSTGTCRKQDIVGTRIVRDSVSHLNQAITSKQHIQTVPGYTVYTVCKHNYNDTIEVC